MKKPLQLALLFSLLSATTALAIDYRVEKLDEPAPADEVSKEVAAQLQPTGVSVIRGESRVLCQIWLAKEWGARSGDPGDQILYPFQMGQLIGVVRYVNKGADFRDQDIGKGTYTMRYALQPVDGAHVGTSPTRDFLLLVSAAKDKSPALVGDRQLIPLSAEAAESSHPAMLAMQRIDGETGTLPSIREDEEREWWVVRLSSNAKRDGAVKPLAFDLVVVGQFVE